MHSSKRQKIDLSTDYPCPCRRKARLLPIALTEALGCDRCPNVFVLTSDGEQVEQVAGLLLSRRLWWWTGQQWVLAQSHRQQWNGWLLAIVGMILVAVVVYLAILHLPGQFAVWGCVLVVLLFPVLFDVLRQWWISRSRSRDS